MKVGDSCWGGGDGEVRHSNGDSGVEADRTTRTSHGNGVTAHRSVLGYSHVHH